MEEEEDKLYYYPLHSPSAPPPSSPAERLSALLPLHSPSAPPPSSPAERLSALLEEIAAIPDFRNSFRKLLHALSRRIKLLDPLAEELLDKGPVPTPEPAVQRTLEPLLAALGEAKDFLNFASEGSKIYLVLEKEAFMKRHQQVISQLVESLDVITYDELGISDEVREQACLSLS